MENLAGKHVPPDGFQGNSSRAETTDPESFARRYQLEILQKAIEQNTIAFLDTGSGKTLIAVMFIKSYAHLIRKPQNNIAVFMVPTVVLVQQQANVLEMHTDLKVGRYWGAMGVDLWDHKKWEEELNTHEVFVMTPQIFLDNLRHCFFQFETVRLVIFDECHHTRKNTPYACIMNEFYHRKATANVNNLPRIFGMTASPVYCKGTSSSSCAAEVQHLETILNAKVYTLEDTTELERVLVYPDLKRNYYDSKEVPYTLLQNLKRELEDIQYKHTQFESHSTDGGTLETARKKIGKLHLNLLFCAEEMGIWGAAKASEILLNTKLNTFEGNLVSNEFVANTRKHFLQDAMKACNKFLPSDKSWRCGKYLDGDVTSGYLSSKIQCLIESLLDYRDWKQVRCIVFVRRVLVAMVIGSLFQCLDCMSVFKTEYIVGSQTKLQAQTRRQQAEIVEAFREGKVNIIVATQVIEEGFDIKGCNLVIRFDFSDTICSFIQSRGRARMQGSHYVFLIKRGDVDQEKQIDNFLKSEQIMRHAALNRTLIPPDMHIKSMPSTEIYCVASTGAIVSLESSVALVHYYCSQLPGDRYYTPRPIFHINKEIGECIMELPRNCPILTIKVKGKCSLLKQLACLEACKKLHAVGALTHYLLPAREEYEKDEEDESVENVSATNCTVELPPELCKPIFCGISTSILYTFQFLPSVMHRIESILSAAKLRKTFSSQQPYNFNISTFKVLEALTRKKCQECMSLESLETLGDAFLKYVSSRHVFTTNAQKHEGQLTSKRKQIISNYALYKIGCNRQLPGFIRNELFDPKQWVIPGQHIPSPSGFSQGKSYSMENLYIKGCRFMKIKNIADVVEALIGACLDCGGQIVAVNFIKWIGINIDLGKETSIINRLDTRVPASVNIPSMESLLKYSFRNRNLLVEALTHASYQVAGVSGCYQRLEFLGDAVLDYLITSYLYKTYPQLSPGELTDLKSAAVNNDCYAQAAVKWNLQQQLLHASNVLQRNITDFVQLISSSSESRSHSYGWCTTESAVPKVLGDLIESIAGAVLIDSGFNTDLVWTTMKHLLEPIVTPESVCYHPIRELQELCQKKNYKLNFSATPKEGKFSVKVKVVAGDHIYTETCDGSNKKTGKKLAAEKVLKSLRHLKWEYSKD